MCVFCGLNILTRGHHIVPKSKGGTVIKNTCQTCEDFIHNTWTHNELRDFFNTIDKIKATDQFKKFLKWRLKQDHSSFFKTHRNNNRNKRKYS